MPMFSTERYGGTMPSAWMGMRLGAWLRLLAYGGFDVSLNCLPRLVPPSLVAPVNSLLAALSETFYGRRIDAVEVLPPVFVIGHWRTGTTLMHELLAEDPRLGAPTVYQCFFPNTFLLFPWLGGALSRLLQPTRSFDNIPLGHDRPQEEEFALLNLGVGTPYRSLAFPRHGAAGVEFVDLHDLPAPERQAWERAYLRLVKALQLAHGKRLVLKSPPNTGRVATLLRLFPEARFIHLSRNPYEVFPSTVHTWKVLGSWQGLHNPGLDDEALKAVTLDVFNRLFGAYERERHLIPPGHLAEVRFEDLVSDPVATLKGVYRTLSLGDFEPARPCVEAYLGARSSYQRNVFAVDSDDRAAVARCWEPYFRRFGYAL